VSLVEGRQGSGDRRLARRRRRRWHVSDGGADATKPFDLGEQCQVALDARSFGGGDLTVEIGAGQLGVVR
jgi:hypothetical protein